MSEGLATITARGEPWTLQDESTLRNAYRASAQPALALCDFIRSVLDWVQNGDPPSYQERRAWLPTASCFLAKIDPEDYRIALSAEPDVRERCRRLLFFAHCPGVRERLGPAIQHTLNAFLTGAPNEPPDALPPWTTAYRQLLEVLVVVERGSPLVHTALGGARPWLLTETFLTADSSPYPKRLREAVARHLESNHADAIADALYRGGSRWLRDLINEIARGPDPERIVLPASIALESREPRLAGQLRAASGAARSAPRYEGGIATEYLNARPRNAAHVFDLLSAHQESASIEPVHDWGLSTVTTGMSTSLFVSYGGTDERKGIFAPRFPARDVLRSVDQDAAVCMTVRQRSVRYGFHLLCQLAHARRETDADTLIERVLDDRLFRTRLEMAKGLDAAVVLQRLDGLRYASPHADTLLVTLYPVLIPRLPDGYLLPGLHRHEDVWRPLVEREIDRRLGRAKGAETLSAIVSGVRELPIDWPARFAMVETSAACPAPDEPIADWTVALAQLRPTVSDFVDRVLRSADAETLCEAIAHAEAFEWQRLGAALLSTLQQKNHGAAANALARRDLADDRATIVAVANQQWTFDFAEYLDNLAMVSVDAAYSQLAELICHSVEHVAPPLLPILNGRPWADPLDVLGFAGARLSRALDTEDAAVAVEMVLEWSADAQKREYAVRYLREVIRRAGSAKYYGALGRVRDHLQAQSPDLWRLLTR